MNRRRNGQGPCLRRERCKGKPLQAAHRPAHDCPWHTLLFCCRPKTAPGERHTPCHDAIQGIAGIRRSGPLPGKSLRPTPTTTIALAPSLLGPHDASPRSPIHHLTIALAASLKKQPPRSHPAHPPEQAHSSLNPPWRPSTTLPAPRPV